MRTRQAGYHGFGALGGLALVSSGMAGMLLTSPTTPTINPCNLNLTVATSPSNTPSTTPPASTSPSPGNSGPSTSPSPSASSSAPTGQLCVQVQAMPSGIAVLPGADANFAVWVWFAGTTTGDATVTLTTQPAMLPAVFTVCPQAGTATCGVSLASGQATELVAKVTVPQKSPPSSVTLIGTGTSPEAGSPASGWDSVSVQTPATPTPTPTASSTSGTPTPAGVGATLPPGTLPPATLPAGVVPSASLPTLPDAATSPPLAFPQVTPDPTPAAPARPIRVADVSAQFPLDPRLVGGQIVGLAVLAAAITIAVARLSLRKQHPQHSKNPG